MLKFNILNTEVAEVRYAFVPKPGEEKIDIQTTTNGKLLRNSANPNLVVVETTVFSKSPSGNLDFSIRTLSFIELGIKMSDAEINNECLPLVLTAVNEKIKAVSGCLNLPHLEMPPIQQLIQDMLKN